MKKVVHIISNKVWGGGEQYVYDLCDSLSRDGYEVELLVRPIDAIESKVSKLGVQVGRLCFMQILKLDDCIIHVHNFKDALKVAIAKKLAGRNTKIIVTRHLVRKAKTSWLYTWLYSFVDKIIFVSELAKEEFLAVHPKVDESRICMVRNSIKSSEGVNNADDIKGCLPQGTLILMYHGRIAEEKGLATLVEAVAEMKDMPYHLFLLGTGDAGFCEKLQKQIETSGVGDRITFLGFRDDVTGYINQTDIGIIPTIAQESCGLSCMEYMKSGKCLVTTNNGGQAEYVTNDETGLLVPPGDAKALRDAICRASEIKDIIGKNAREYFDRELSYEHFYNKIKRIYEE